MILGLQPERLSIESVNQAWKEQMSAPGVHPDLGGDQEAAIFLYTAKDTLLKWIEGQPGFGFGGDSGDGRGPYQPSGVPNKPLLSAGSADIALPPPSPEENLET